MIIARHPYQSIRSAAAAAAGQAREANHIQFTASFQRNAPTLILDQSEIVELALKPSGTQGSNTKLDETGTYFYNFLISR